MSPYLNILCVSSENSHTFEHDAQLLYTIPSKLTINTGYEHHQVNSLLCNLTPWPIVLHGV